MTPPLSDDDRRALGIEAAREPALLGRDRPDDDGVGHGFSLPPGAPLELAALRDRFASITDIAAFALTAARVGAPEASVARADRHRGQYQFAAEGLAVDALGDARESGGCWYVDARRERVLLRARGAQGECLLRFEGDLCEWFDLPTATARAAGGVTPLSADDLLGGFDAPAWLTEPLAQATGDDPFATFAAVGTIGRLWAPRGTTTPPALALARLQADDDPMARARRWAEAAAVSVRSDVARGVAAAIEALDAALDGLSEAPAEEARRWLERRDDLASVDRLLASRGEAPWRPALAALDRRAGAHATLWRARAPVVSPRLAAAAWQEPEAWWAAPARSR